MEGLPVDDIMTALREIHASTDAQHIFKLAYCLNAEWQSTLFSAGADRSDEMKRHWLAYMVRNATPVERAKPDDDQKFKNVCSKLGIVGFHETSYDLGLNSLLWGRQNRLRVWESGTVSEVDGAVPVEQDYRILRQTLLNQAWECVRHLGPDLWFDNWEEVMAMISADGGRIWAPG